MRLLRNLAASVALALLLAACGEEKGAVQPPETIVLPLRTFALNVDPATLADVDSRKVATLLHAGLVALDQDGRVTPRVARTWRRIDPVTWEFELFPGLRFSNGKSVTTEGVIASLCASMQPDNTQAWSLRSIDHESSAAGSVRCTGLSNVGGRLRIREAQPSPWLFEGLAGPGGWIVDVEAAPAAYGVRPGVGPYQVSQVRQDQQVVLTGRAGGATPPGVNRVIFRYLPDPGVAAAAFNSGQISLLEIDSPAIQHLVTGSGDRMVREGARVVRAPTDRVRVIVFNFDRLRERGFTTEDIRSLMAVYSTATPRTSLVRLSTGLANPMLSAFPPVPNLEMPQARDAPSQSTELRLISENDPYTDQLAASLPRRVGDITIRYTTLEKSLFLSALFEKDYDLAFLTLEATHHTPHFWTAFFTPGNPYTVFGMPLRGFGEIDLRSQSGLRVAAVRVNTEGNWVPVIRDVRAVAISGELDGVRLTSSGQLSLEGVHWR